MMRGLLFSKKGQSTAEYAILIGLVIATAVAVQTYVKRGLQGRFKDSVDEFVSSQEHKMILGDSVTVDYSFTDWKKAQWEPDYLASTFTTERASDLTEKTPKGEGGKVTRDSTTTTLREGEQTFGY